VTAARIAPVVDLTLAGSRASQFRRDFIIATSRPDELRLVLEYSANSIKDPPTAEDSFVTRRRAQHAGRRGMRRPLR